MMVLVRVILMGAGVGAAPLEEPFAYLNGLVAPSGAPAPPLSPDPLVGVRWEAAVNASALQV